MPPIRPYPLFLHLHRRPVLVVGGGAVAQRKVAALLDSGAAVTVISPQFSPNLRRSGAITRIRAPYAPRHLKQKPWRLVFAATDSPPANARVAQHAAAAGILCCRCDDPAASDFINGAVSHLSAATLALSTAGASPAIARRLRDQALTALDPILLQLAALCDSWRPRVKARIHAPAPRRHLLLRLAGEEMETTLRTSGPAAAKKLFARWLAQASPTPPRAPSRRTPLHA